MKKHWESADLQRGQTVGGPAHVSAFRQTVVMVIWCEERAHVAGAQMSQVWLIKSAGSGSVVAASLPICLSIHSVVMAPKKHLTFDLGSSKVYQRANRAARLGLAMFWCVCTDKTNRLNLLKHFKEAVPGLFADFRLFMHRLSTSLNARI